MWAKNKQTKMIGFTIVELLIVIVVIGILAAITIVAFNGVQNKAKVSALQTDLTNASKQIKLWAVEKGIYPDSITDCPAPSTVSVCLKPSSGIAYTDYQVDNAVAPRVFCVTARYSDGTLYRITDEGKPAPGSCAPASCWAILSQGGSTGSGIYWIKPAGATASTRVYCDMTTSGGGWTLLVANPGPHTVWNLTTVRSLNSNTPSIDSPYSILDKGDAIKTNLNGNLQYRIDAENFGRWGGVWEAPYANTFSGTVMQNNAVNIEKYDSWTIHTSSGGAEGLTNIMPYINALQETLTTWDRVGGWWGTLVTGYPSWSPAPYMSAEKPAPGKIWYWVK